MHTVTVSITSINVSFFLWCSFRVQWVVLVALPLHSRIDLGSWLAGDHSCVLTGTCEGFEPRDLSVVLNRQFFCLLSAGFGSIQDYILLLLE